MKKVLLSGIKPTGDLHLGNYFGAIKQFVALQDSYEAYIFVADLHALTSTQDAALLREQVFNIAAAYIACGLDPEKVVLFKQSAIGGELAELTWIFNCITTVPYLERAHAYKDAVANGKEPSVGLFDYPLLMAADILMQDSQTVPVGRDQKQHIEYARDTAQKFNRTWEEVFTLPEDLIIDAIAVVPGIDGRKMSKSYNNTIALFASDEEISKQVMAIVTDSSGERPENVYAIHKLFRSDEELASLYEENKGKYKVLKEALIADIQAFVGPIRTRYEELHSDRSIVERALERGEAVVKARAQKKMAAVRKAVGLM